MPLFGWDIDMKCDNYQDAVSLLTGRCKTRRKLENNTYLERLDDHRIGVKLHNTYVVIYHNSGQYTLDSGGWNTMLTRDRINKYSPFTVFTERGTMWLSVGDTWEERKKRSVLFKDNMQISPDGLEGLTPESPETKMILRKKAQLKKRIAEYCKKFVSQLPSDKPGPGDCFWCQMVDAKTGKLIEDTSHLETHIHDNYFVPSLLYHALTESGARQGWWYHAFDNGGKKYNPRISSRGAISSDTIYRILYKYLTKRLVK